MQLKPVVNPLVDLRAEELVRLRLQNLYRRTDRLFAWLMAVQWISGILLACTVTPRTWEGTQSSMHPHVLSSIYLGGALSCSAWCWLYFRPGSAVTRHVVAIIQMLWASLLIHLTGGRIETHFHIFGSLAFLAFYRDGKILITATMVVALDHLVRGFFWPYSVYGVLNANIWRSFEHAAWVVFENVFLIIAIRQSRAEMRGNATAHALLEQSHQHIEEEVRLRTAELKTTEEKLLHSQKMEAVGRLAGGVAHEFNNLLCIISGNSEALRDEYGPETAAHEIGLEISQAADRASALTRQLLTFGRQHRAAPELLDLNEIVQCSRSMLTRLIGADIQLVATLDPNLRQVKADAGQVEQIICNLAINSRDAMPQGGNLTIETANITLHGKMVASKPDVQSGDYVLLAVSDTGCGMDETTKSQIFEPFFTTKEQGKGTGLGLATVYGIVKQWEGCIEVYSEVGVGTSFKIYLPAHGPRKEPVALPPVERSETVGTGTILLVEDEETVRGLARRTLINRGYQVLEAADGVQALGISQNFEGEIDLMLTDVVMPKMGGRELAEAILLKRAGMRILFMSGYTDDAIVRHGILPAETDFLQKPFNGESLTRKVRSVLDDLRLDRKVNMSLHAN